MAVYPCDLHQGRYRGPAAHAYATWYASHEPERVRYRVCPDCLAELLDLADQQLLPAEGADALGQFPLLCGSCSQLLGGSRSPFYLTVFSGTERWDFWQLYCGPCATALPGDQLASKLRASAAHGGPVGWRDLPRSQAVLNE